MMLVYNSNLSATYNGQIHKTEFRLLSKIYKIDIASPQLQYLGILQFQFQEVVYLHVTGRTEILHAYMNTF